MRKIPTLFVRDEDTGRRYVKDELTPGCEWVLAGEGEATRKYDGTCVMFDGWSWWARREVKPGKESPANFREVDHDDTTGKTVGWEPVDQSGFGKFLAEAITNDFAPVGLVGGMPDSDALAGTYELCGPKVNGNPEGYACHVLIRHADAQVIPLAAWLTFDNLRERLTTDWPHEGIVWHHLDGRMAKLKKKDFPS